MPGMRHLRAFLAMLRNYTPLIVVSSVMIYPLAFTFLGSLMTMDTYSQVTLLPIPNPPSFVYYKILFDNFDTSLWPAVRITLLRVTWYIGLSVLGSLFGGYALSRLRFRGKNFVLVFFLAGLGIPVILISLPTYMMVARFPLAGGNNILGVGGHGFVNEWPVLFITDWVNILALFLVKQSYDMLPIEYEEAAKLDGAGFFTIIFRVYMPLLRPVLVAVVVITFVNIWNDYYWPQITVLGRRDLIPIAVAVQQRMFGMSQGGSLNSFPYPPVFTMAIIVSLPPLTIYFLLQRYFVQGLAATGIKG